jgi:divalent metal cation (Fe/Co/Zn/Cd) transporter
VNRRDNGPQPSYRVTTMVATLAHRHGRHVHAHAHDRPHRHLLRLRRSTPISADNAHREHSHHHRHEHSHGLVDPSISRSRDGVRAVGLSLIALGATAIAQFVVFIATNSIALLADLIHNIGDAATAFPLGAAFLLRSARAERWAGLAVVLAILLSACVAGAEAIDRLINPQQPEHLVALALAGGLGFAGNWVAATIRSRAGRRLDSPALIADGDHARADAYVSLAVIASAATVGVGLDIADPIIGLAITAVILRITVQSWQTVRGHPH